MPVTKKKSIKSTATKTKTAKKKVVVPAAVATPPPTKNKLKEEAKPVKVLSKVTKFFSIGPEKFNFVKDKTYTIKKHQSDYLEELGLIVVLD